MQTVVQLRVSKAMKASSRNHDKLDARMEASRRIMDKARSNLMARRSDRMGAKASNTINLAVMVSQLGTPEAAINRKIAEQQMTQEEEGLLRSRESCQTPTKK